LAETWASFGTYVAIVFNPVLPPLDKLGHLSSFYNCAYKKKNITGVHPETKQWH